MLKSDSAVLESILTAENDEKCFLFHRKISFRSQDFYTFVLTPWSCIKTARFEK